MHAPHVFGNEEKYLKKCIDKNHFTFGEFLNLLPKEISTITGSRYPVLVQNCTSALYLCLKFLNTLKDDEIIVPSITFIATVNVIKYCQANPIFMDVDEYCNLDIKKTTEFLIDHTFYKNGSTYNKKTKKRISSIIFVHTFGNLANMDKKFLDLCKRKSINIVEDAAESLGSFYTKNGKKHHAGTMGTIGSISFNGNKIITSAGGGAVLTNNNNISKKISYWSNQAKDHEIDFIHNEVGYNFRLSNVHAAIGLAQIENLNKIIKLKKKIHEQYKKKIDRISGLSVMSPPDYSLSNYWINILKIDKEYKYSKEQILKKLNIKGIQARPIWLPNHLQKPYKKNQHYKIYMSNKIYASYLCLPSSSFLKSKDINKIVEAIK